MTIALNLLADVRWRGKPVAGDRPQALRDYGFAEDAIPDAAAAILPAVPESNPRPVTVADLERLLRAAWSGADPKEGP